ncbi:MAG: hypothetical protein C0519_09730 [Hyphomicrobium sp.]|nr:hypothetical protein [Hyphomicrobium sp.]
MRHPYRQATGSGLTDQTEQYIRQSLDIVRPQLGFIREEYFQGAFAPPQAFKGITSFPFVAGYVLGVTGAFLVHKGVSLNEHETLASVVDISNLFMVNRCDCEISLHYTMQQPIYDFGLDVGAAEFALSLAARARGEPIQFMMLAQYLMTFLKYPDDRTLRLNLELMGKALSLKPQDYDDHVRRWNIQKQYSFRVE